MRRLATVSSTISLLAVLGALLSGCPVWGPDHTGNRSCDRNEECPSGRYCNTSTRECVVSQPCAGGASCGAGYFCDDRDVCVPGCSSTSDCTALGAELICNPTSNRCEPSGRCSSDTLCETAGEVCVDGSCRPSDQLCQFDYQCGGGQACVDGRCIARCSANADAGAGACAAGQVCTDGFCQYPGGTSCSNCSPEQVCLNGACVAGCSTDMQCAMGQFCENGACRIDDRRPAPFCRPPAEGCAAGSLCIDGVCRISCPGSTAEECQRRDVNFNTCDSQNICRYSNEANPQCARNADCGADRLCVNAICSN